MTYTLGYLEPQGKSFISRRRPEPLLQVVLTHDLHCSLAAFLRYSAAESTGHNWTGQRWVSGCQCSQKATEWGTNEVTAATTLHLEVRWGSQRPRNRMPKHQKPEIPGSLRWSLKCSSSQNKLHTNTYTRKFIFGCINMSMYMYIYRYIEKGIHICMYI